MENTTLDMLEKDIGAVRTKMESLTPGTPEYSAAVDSYMKMYDRRLKETELDRAFMERSDRDLDKEREWNYKTAQLEEQKKDRWTRIGLDVASIAVPAILYGVAVAAGFKHEFKLNGAYTSRTFKDLVLGRLRAGR